MPGKHQLNEALKRERAFDRVVNHIVWHDPLLWILNLHQPLRADPKFDSIVFARHLFETDLVELAEIHQGAVHIKQIRPSGRLAPRLTQRRDDLIERNGLKLTKIKVIQYSI